jgi:hypothetical protein
MTLIWNFLYFGNEIPISYIYNLDKLKYFYGYLGCDPRKECNINSISLRNFKNLEFIGGRIYSDSIIVDNKNLVACVLSVQDNTSYFQIKYAPKLISFELNSDKLFFFEIEKEKKLEYLNVMSYDSDTLNIQLKSKLNKLKYITAYSNNLINFKTKYKLNSLIDIYFNYDD